MLLLVRLAVVLAAVDEAALVAEGARAARLVPLAGLFEVRGARAVATQAVVRSERSEQRAPGEAGRQVRGSILNSGTLRQRKRSAAESGPDTVHRDRHMLPGATERAEMPERASVLNL